MFPSATVDTSKTVVSFRWTFYVPRHPLIRCHRVKRCSLIKFVGNENSTAHRYTHNIIHLSCKNNIGMIYFIVYNISISVSEIGLVLAHDQFRGCPNIFFLHIYITHCILHTIRTIISQHIIFYVFIAIIYGDRKVCSYYNIVGLLFLSRAYNIILYISIRVARIIVILCLPAGHVCS